MLLIASLPQSIRQIEQLQSVPLNSVGTLKDLRDLGGDGWKDLFKLLPVPEGVHAVIMASLSNLIDQYHESSSDESTPPL